MLEGREEKGEKQRAEVSAIRIWRNRNRGGKEKRFKREEGWGIWRKMKETAWRERREFWRHIWNGWTRGTICRLLQESQRIRVLEKRVVPGLFQPRRCSCLVSGKIIRLFIYFAITIFHLTNIKMVWFLVCKVAKTTFINSNNSN